ncbi:sensor histidine kinase [Luteibacter pinisoli]|nr:sensor histidine kinase [Luteibacter pinisoli]
MQRWLPRGVPALLCALWATACLALPPPSDSLRAMNHRAWPVRDGAPADIWALKQDNLGFIWLATGSGRYRFDGVQFKHIEPAPGQAFQSTDMTALEVVSADDVWVGTSNGVIIHLRHGTVSNYAPSTRVQVGPIYNFARARDGTVWAAAGERLIRSTDRGSEVIGQAEFPTRDAAMWVTIDAQGAVWVATDTELWVLGPGSPRFRPTGIRTGNFPSMAIAPDGTLWLSDMDHGTRALPGLDPRQTPLALTQTPINEGFGQGRRIAFDHAGNLWGTPVVGNGVDGVFRVAHPERYATGQPLTAEALTDRFSADEGLLSMVAVPILMDREDNIWIGTNFGLDRFRAKTFHVISPKPNANDEMTWLAQDAMQRVFVLQDGCLFRMEHLAPSVLTCGFLPYTNTLAAAGDMLYARIDIRVYQWTKGNGVTHLETPRPQFSPYATDAGADRDGHLWMYLVDGLHKFDGKTWSYHGIAPELNGIPPAAFAIDPAGTAWIGFDDGRVATWDGQRAMQYGRGNGLDVGAIETIGFHDGKMLVGGDKGLARRRGDGFQSIQMARWNLTGAVTGLLQAQNGDLWLNTTRGILSLPAAEAERAFNEPGYVPAFTRYDGDDGVPGVALMHPGSQTIVQDGDKRLWFADNRGVSWVDPANVRRNAVAPQSLIEGLVVEGRFYPATRTIELPPLTRSMTVRFTAASFVSPQNVRFRYWLRGVDTMWQDGGTSREATYANLKAGSYQFDVMAANSDGLWSQDHATLSFTIEPTFYQTTAFQLLAAIAAALLVAAFVMMQHRRIVAKVKDRLEVRHAERTRIARDLHDTLLQGVQGLILSFQAAAVRLSKDGVAREPLDAALNRAEAVLVEGRNRVQTMRAHEPVATDISMALASLGQALAAETAIEFSLVSKGRQRAIDSTVCDEVHFIGREALLNAFRHAMASRIEVELTYDAAHLRVCVTDNGVGIDTETLNEGGKEGHWGIVGMRERATSIDGTLTVQTREGAGTQVELVVPGAVAYARQTRTPFPVPAWLRRLWKASPSEGA